MPSLSLVLWAVVLLRVVTLVVVPARVLLVLLILLLVVLMAEMVGIVAAVAVPNSLLLDGNALLPVVPSWGTQSPHTTTNRSITSEPEVLPHALPL